MISPKENLVLRSDRPPFRITRWHWVVGCILRPLLRRRLKEQYEARLAHASSLMAAAGECETREALEALLGPPVYGMDSRLYCGISPNRSDVRHPDLVEVYHKDGCLVEIWYKNGSIQSMCAMPLPTVWEIVTDAIG